MKRRLSVFLSTLFGIGYIPFAPGTYATAATAIAYYYFVKSTQNSLSSLTSSIILLIFTGIIYYLGVLLSTEAEKTLGHDNGKIVIDEFCGYLISVLFLPSVTIGRLWLIIVYSFVFFRVFDITKPWPIGKSQNLKAGWGIMTDDFIAGVYANLLLQIIIKIYPNFFGIYN
jgi:phosphatidylglycerophosphatase A